MEIDKYITIEDDASSLQPLRDVELEPSPKKKKETKRTQPEDHEITRKRDILASVALLDGLESYIGENITAIQIRKMKKEKLESYFLLYQEKAGQESTNEMSSLVEMSVKGLSFVVDIDNQEDLKNDLVNNKQLRRRIGKQVAEITEKYGDFVAIAKVLFTVGKHLSFSPAEKDSAEESKTTPSTITDSASTITDSASTITDSASTC